MIHLPDDAPAPPGTSWLTLKIPISDRLRDAYGPDELSSELASRLLVAVATMDNEA